MRSMSNMSGSNKYTGSKQYPAPSIDLQRDIQQASLMLDTSQMPLSPIGVSMIQPTPSNDMLNQKMMHDYQNQISQL